MGFVAVGPTRVIALLTVATLTAGLLTTAVSVSRERPGAGRDASDALSAAAAVSPALSGPGGTAARLGVTSAYLVSDRRPACAGPACGHADVGRARRELATVATRGERAGRRVDGVRWALASWVGTHPAGTARVRRDGRRAEVLAAAARRLLPALEPLEDGDADAGRLDDLARGLSRYTTAAVRVGAPGVEGLERASVAAGLLAGLSGADGPRTWAVCTPSGPCSRLTVAGGEVTRRRGGEPTSSPGDVVVRVGDALGSEEMLFGTPEPGARQRFDARAVYRLLIERPGAVTSGRPDEQAALVRLGG